MLTPTRILLLVALLEVAIDRIAVPLARPQEGVPPGWHVALDYTGLFLQYFAGTLSVAILIGRAVPALLARRDLRDSIAQVASITAALLAAVALVVRPPDVIVVALELAFAVAVIALVVATFARGRDLGVQLGLIALAAPLLVHTFNVIGTRYLWPETAYDGKIVAIERAGVMALCIGALVSPYVFAPRPFARSVTRPGPVVFAMVIAAFGAVSARLWYPQLAEGAKLAIGVTLDQDQADPRLAIYLLAFATLAWTLASCALAETEARRQIGIGIVFVVLGGYAFAWTHHYVLPLLGIALVADAGRRVRDEELESLPFTSDTPPIQDASWSAYITAAKGALENILGAVHTVTTRGEGGLTTTLIVGERGGLPVRIRIERIDGSVIAFDIVVGREIDETRGATLCLWAIAPRALGINPSGPPAAPTFKSGDETFDVRFRARGSALAFQKLFDAPLRARATTTLDGWLAYWEREGLRYRVYPGRGAPLDHPLPLSDLALGRAATADRLAALVELLGELGERGVEPVPPTAQGSLDDLPAMSEGTA
ncbi:MAG: hypothetical protein ABI678_18295 [Kofleriaceae bacterium]